MLAGGGPEEQALRDRLGDHATFLGWQYGADLARVYASADVFLFASRTDTFGQVVLEAQASGLPVVAVGEGGPATLIEDGETGLLAAADPQALATRSTRSSTARCWPSACAARRCRRSARAPGRRRCSGWPTVTAARFAAAKPLPRAKSRSSASAGPASWGSPGQLGLARPAGARPRVYGSQQALLHVTIVVRVQARRMGDPGAPPKRRRKAESEDHDCDRNTTA